MFNVDTIPSLPAEAAPYPTYERGTVKLLQPCPACGDRHTFDNGLGDALLPCDGSAVLLREPTEDEYRRRYDPHFADLIPPRWRQPTIAELRRMCVVNFGWPDDALAVRPTSPRGSLVETEHAVCVPLGVPVQGYRYVGLAIGGEADTTIAGTVYAMFPDKEMLHTTDHDGALMLFRLPMTADCGAPVTWHLTDDAGDAAGAVRLMTRGAFPLAGQAVGNLGMLSLIAWDWWSADRRRVKDYLAPPAAAIPGIENIGVLVDAIERATQHMNVEKEETEDCTLPEAQEIRPSQNLPDIALDPRDTPMDRAKIFVDACFSTGTQHTLCRHRGEFYRWTGTYYRVIPAEDVRTHLYRLFDNARAPGGGRFGFKKADVDVALDAVKAETLISSHIDVPVWLDQRDAPGPAALVPLSNGLLDPMTRELTRHTPQYFGTYALPFPYRARAAQPATWLQFLGSVWPNDPESVALLQEWFGYCLTSDTRQHKILMIVGPMRSGKGTIGRVLKEMLGTVNVCGPTLFSLGQLFGMQPLLGKLLAIISDARLDQSSNKGVITERLLSISGEDTLSVDRKHMEVWTGKLSTRLLIMTNEIPRLSDTSGALASRFLILRMTESFLGREDLDLSQKLLAEMPGILRWALDGLHRLQQRGRFVQPKSADQLASSLADTSSPVAAFVRDHCLRGPEYSIRKAVVHQAWIAYCRSRNWPEESAVSFSRKLLAVAPEITERKPSVDHGSDLGQQRIRLWQGIGLKPGTALAADVNGIEVDE